MSIIKTVESIITNVINDLGYEVEHVQLLNSARPDLGQFQINEAMMLGKKNHKNPREVAEEIVLELEGNGIFTKLNIAGPGFINLSLSDSFLENSLNKMIDLKSNNIDYPTSKKIIIDYGGANIAKELHVGHLRSANIGEALKRLARLLGNEVIGDVHLGDWGLPMGLVMREIKEMHPDLVYFDDHYQGDYPTTSPVTEEELAVIYPRASQRKKEDETYLKEAQEMTAKLQAGYKGYRALWRHIVNTSSNDIKKVYKDLNTEFDLWLGESDAHDSIPRIIEIFKEKKLTKKDDGALIVEVKDPTDKKEVPPILLIKSNGASGYQTTEIATIYNRVRDYNPDAIWYLTDARQTLHFEQVFRACKKAEIVREDVSLEYLPFGTMNGPDGKPFKTRDGGVMSLKNLIQIVEEEAVKKINVDIVGEEKKQDTAHAIAISTIKYADLIPFRTTDYIFDPKKFSETEGKTATYLLYSTIRMKSLLTKAQAQNENILSYKKVFTASEREVILTLLQLPKILTKSYETRSLNEISEFLYRLTNSYNKFYTEHKILTENDLDKKESWLFLSQVVYNTNIMLLDTLGLNIPEKM